MEDYPHSLGELESRFSTEAACLEYLAQARWPSGFARVWTLGWLTLSSPLFIEPMLRLVAGGFA